MDYITFRQPSDDPEATLLALDGLDTTALLRLASNRPSRSELDLAIEGRLRDALDAMAELEAELRRARRTIQRLRGVE